MQIQQFMLSRKSFEILNRIEHLPGELGVKEDKFYQSINDSPNFKVELLEGKIEIQMTCMKLSPIT